jgi:Protein phosphatase 2C
VFETTSGLVIGRAHVARGLPCQDAVATCTSTHGVVTAAADGLGSAVRSQVGSHTAATVAVATALQALGSEPPAEVVRRASVAAAEALAADAVTLACPASELATTLSVAVIGFAAEEVAIGASGDCIHIVRDRSGTLHVVADQPPAGFANVVSGLHRGIEPRVTVLPLEAVDAVLLSTDGLEHLLLRRPADERWPQPPLCHELIDGEAGRIDQLLRDRAVRELTDDDCAVVTIRRHPDTAGQRVYLTSGEQVHIGPVERLNGLRVRRVVKRPGLCVVPLPKWCDERLEEMVCSPPELMWPARCAWPLIAWPQAVVVGKRDMPGGLVIRHPGVLCANPVKLHTCVPALGAIVGLLHRHGLAHGELGPHSFVPGPATNLQGGSLMLVDIGPLFSGEPANTRASRDLEFVEHVGR